MIWPARARKRTKRPDGVEATCHVCGWVFERKPREGSIWARDEFDAATHSMLVALRHHFETQHPEVDQP